jgi:hypothetical protein
MRYTRGQRNSSQNGGTAFCEVKTGAKKKFINNEISNITQSDDSTKIDEIKAQSALRIKKGAMKDAVE